MMKNKFILNLLCITVFLTYASNTLVAQTRKQPGDLNKYEVAVDLQHFFSDGLPDKVLFKINNIREKQIKGAYRFGVNLNYKKLTYNVTQNGVDYNETSDLNSSMMGIILGYEAHKTYKNAVMYYGLDLGSQLSFENEKVIDMPGDRKDFGLALTPFVGVKVFLTESLALAIEAGLQNLYAFDNYQAGNNPNNKVKIRSFSSFFQFPYNLSLNFNF